MSEQTAQKQSYMASVHNSGDIGEAPIFTITPQFPPQKHGTVGALRHVSQYEVTISEAAEGLNFDWSGNPDVPQIAKEEIEKEIRDRMTDRAEWIDRVQSLVDQVEAWAGEMGWSTRRIEKKLDDTRIGKHRVPALLMQEDAFRVLLEPVGRSAPGVEGVVDLYLMPAYDDIASLYYYEGRWNIHYRFPDIEAMTAVPESEAAPLSKEILKKVLAELIQHAA